MTKWFAGTAICAAALIGSSAVAQSFTYDIVWEPVESIGGMTGPDGPQYRGGVVSGKYTTTFEDGTVLRGDVRCVGMGQPDGGIFRIHLTCSFSDGEASGTSVYGCNFLGEPGPDTPLGCVGGIEGKTGDFAGRRGSLTMEWYTDKNARGTGQWYGQ